MRQRLSQGWSCDALALDGSIRFSMALIKLLAAGRSWSEPRDRPHRYKLKNGVLPTFGNNPSAVVERHVDSNAETTVSQKPSAVPDAPKQFCGTETMKAEPVAEPTFEMGAPQSGASLKRWSWKVNPFKARSAKQPVTAPCQTLQGELSLDKVKVKRNDLSDSDLEVVSAHRPNVFAAPVAATTEGEAKKHSLLSRVAARLFRVKQD